MKSPTVTLVGYVPKSGDDAPVVWANDRISSHKFTAFHGTHLYDVLFHDETIRPPQRNPPHRISPIYPYRYN